MAPSSVNPKLAILKLLLATVVALYFGLAGFGSTPAGVQCPTAPIQTVTAFQSRVCGCPVKITRAPRPGDKEFVQCRCAEKKQGKALGSSSVKEALGCLASALVYSAGTRTQASATLNPDFPLLLQPPSVPFVPPPLV